MTIRRTDLTVLIILQALWAGSYIAIKVALRELTVELLVFLRFGGAAMVLMLITTLRRQHVALSRRDWKWIGLLGIVVYVASPLLAFTGLRFTQAVDVSILVSLEPLATALLAFLIIGESLDRKRILAIALAVPGVLLLSDIGSLAAGDASWWRLIGNLLFVTSLFCEGAHTVFGRAFSRRIPPLTLSAYTFFAGAVAFGMMAWWYLPFDQLATLSWQTWAAVLYLTLGCSALGYTLWFFLLRRLPANTAAISLYLQPVFGTLLGVLLLGEHLSVTGLLGACFILVAMWVGFGRAFRTLPFLSAWRIKRS